MAYSWLLNLKVSAVNLGEARFHAFNPMTEYVLCIDMMNPVVLSSTTCCVHVHVRVYTEHKNIHVYVSAMIDVLFNHIVITLSMRTSSILIRHFVITASILTRHYDHVINTITRHRNHITRYAGARHAWFDDYSKNRNGGKLPSYLATGLECCAARPHHEYWSSDNWWSVNYESRLQITQILRLDLSR